MKSLITLFVLAAVSLMLAGCVSTPAQKIKCLELGMSPETVTEQMGEPFTIRAAKVYENGQWMQAWEYISPVFTVNPKTFWLYFENGKLVQWGQPGDFTAKGGDNVPVTEYSEQKMIK